MEANWLLISAHPSPVDTNRCTVDFVDGVLEGLTGKNVFSTLWSHTAANVGFFPNRASLSKTDGGGP